MGVLGLWHILEQAGCLNDAGEAPSTRAQSLLLAQQPALAAIPAASSAGALCASASAWHAAGVSSAASPAPAFTHMRTPRVLAVDLSVWLMEAHHVSRSVAHAQERAQGGAGAAGAAAPASGDPSALAIPRHKSYLLYLLHRVCSFLRNNLRLVFVTDGCAPTIKSRVQLKDNHAGRASENGQQTHRAKQNPLFLAQIRECTRMLELMDLPVLTLQRGEAEALCGALSARGSCDGVVTTDGDAFLFGARSVLRNLQASSTNLEATIVSMDSVQRHTQLDRHKLILLALLLGSDYTSGVHGLGPHRAIRFIRVLDACGSKFDATPEGRARPAQEHRTVALFRAIMGKESSEAAVHMLLSCHPDADAIALPALPPATAAAAAASSSPSVAASSSPAPLAVPYASMTLEQLKHEMAQRGLKPQSKAAMIAKLQQIAALSPTANANGASSPPPAAAGVICLSDGNDDSSESDTEAPSASQQQRPRKPRGPKASKSHVSLSTFLRTYMSKIHARYHGPERQKEMELVLQSYLKPDLHPSVDTLEQRLHTRIPQPSFLRLRAFLTDACALSHARFEKIFLPVELHLDLWRRQHARFMEQQRLEALAAFADAVEEAGEGEDEVQDLTAEDEDDVILLTPPSSRSDAAAPPLSGASTASCGSVKSSVTAAAAGPLHSSSVAAPVAAPDARYTLSHIFRRRVVHGVPHFVLYWRKTPLGYKELASVPKQTDALVAAAAAAAAAAGAANGAAASELDDDDDEEIDMTLPSPDPPSQPASSSSAAASASASAPAAVAPSRVASAPRDPVQQLDLSLFETLEPASFVCACCPELVARFEAEEAEEATRKAQAKEKAQADKVAAREQKKQERAAAKEIAAPPKTTKPRGRPRKPLIADANTPSIASFLSPLPAALANPSNPSPSPSPPPVASSSVPSFSNPCSTGAPSRSSSTSGVSTSIPFPSSKSGSSSLGLGLLAEKAPTIFAALMKDARPSGTEGPTSKATTTHVKEKTETKRQQSTLHGFIHRKPPALERAPPPPPPVAPSAPVSMLLSSPPPPPSSSVPSLLSAELSTCPVCGDALPRRFIDSHVNACLEEQQVQEDQRLAATFAQPQRQPKIGEAGHSRTRGEELWLCSNSSDDESLHNSPPTAAMVRSRASSRSNRDESPAASRAARSRPASKPTTPLKRKQKQQQAHVADVDSTLSVHDAIQRALCGSSPFDGGSASPPSPLAAAPVPAPAPAPAPARRALIDLLSSSDDDEEEAGPKESVGVCHDEFEPGSTVYGLAR